MKVYLSKLQKYLSNQTSPNQTRLFLKRYPVNPSCRGCRRCAGGSCRRARAAAAPNSSPARARVSRAGVRPSPPPPGCTVARAAVAAATTAVAFSFFPTCFLIYFFKRAFGACPPRPRPLYRERGRLGRLAAARPDLVGSVSRGGAVASGDGGRGRVVQAPSYLTVY
jgi:hypothetical protein